LVDDEGRLSLLGGFINHRGIESNYIEVILLVVKHLKHSFGQWLCLRHLGILFVWAVLWL
jgi:hypothetical protein